VFTESGGGGSDTFTVIIDGVESGTIVETDTAATFETVLEAMSNVVAGDVNVSGSAGGPWTVEFTQNFAGLYPIISIGATTGTTSVAITNGGLTNITTLAGGRSDTLNRGADEADTTSKDSAGWHEGLPTIRNWGFDFSHALVESDVALLDLERAWLNNSQLQAVVQTPSANTWTGVGTLTSFSMDGPHDDIMTIDGGIQGSGPLTKA
jgi:predicted secreted protein